MKHVMLKVTAGAAALILLISVLASCNKADKATEKVDRPMSVAGEWKISDFTVINDSMGKPCNENELTALNYGSFSLQQDGHWSAPGIRGGTWTANGNRLFVNFENGAPIALTVYRADSTLTMEQPFARKDQLAGGTIYYTFLKQ